MERSLPVIMILNGYDDRAIVRMKLHESRANGTLGGHTYPGGWGYMAPMPWSTWTVLRTPCPHQVPTEQQQFNAHGSGVVVGRAKFMVSTPVIP